MIPEALARAFAKVPAEIITGVVELVGRIVRSDNPKDTLARALQVTAHEVAADAAVDALFSGKAKLKGTGE